MALPMKKAAAMKAMKAKTTSMKAMKAMKVMKAKRVSVIAKGKRARVSVFYGKKEKSKSGKIVSKAAAARAKKAWANSALKAWCDAVKQARKALNLTGFVAVGGKSATGKALYAKAKALLK